MGGNLVKKLFHQQTCPDAVGMTQINLLNLWNSFFAKGVPPQVYSPLESGIEPLVPPTAGLNFF
jgi:hypothetical protein